jgi:excisionase family DNA binding protein
MAILFSDGSLWHPIRGAATEELNPKVKFDNRSDSASVPSLEPLRGARKGGLFGMEKKPPRPEHEIDIEADRLERLFDANEVADRCKVSPKSLHRWAREGRIPAVKFGRLWRFRKSAIDEWINRRMAS